MQRIKKNEKELSNQVKKRVTAALPQKKEDYEGDFGHIVHTGSTLLDLTISGDRIHGGGIPTGILVEIFGPSGSGKTVLLSEIAGTIQRMGGDVLFNDPEARLNPQFAKLFGLELSEGGYSQPDTVPEVFKAVREWKPKTKAKVHGVFADSLAALSTDMEMDAKDGDKMGMRRAKEFSEELRKTCRILKQKGLIMVCSNQVRENLDAGAYGQKYKAPGGLAMEFYSSLRLRTFSPEKIYEIRKVADKEVKRVIGVNIQIEVTKSSISKPYRTAPLTIIFDYGIDDIRQNLKYIKTYTKSTTYKLGGESIGKSMEEAIRHIEQNGLEEDLKEEVIHLWENIERKFKSDRKPKRS